MRSILLATLCLYSLQQIRAQIIRSPLNLLNRPIADAFLESRPFMEAARPYTEVSRNYIDLPRVIETPRYIDSLPTSPLPVPTTTIISDCTPSVCKNLANTINLMIICGLMQNSKANDEIAVKFAAPLLREIIANPSGAIASTTTVSSLLNANSIIPNLALSGNYAPNYLPSNIIAPSYAPNLAPCNNSPNNAALMSNLLKLLGGAV